MSCPVNSLNFYMLIKQKIYQSHWNPAFKKRLLNQLYPPKKIFKYLKFEIGENISSVIYKS